MVFEGAFQSIVGYTAGAEDLIYQNFRCEVRLSADVGKTPCTPEEFPVLDSDGNPTGEQSVFPFPPLCDNGDKTPYYTARSRVNIASFPGDPLHVDIYTRSHGSWQLLGDSAGEDTIYGALAETRQPDSGDDWTGGDVYERIDVDWGRFYYTLAEEPVCCPTPMYWGDPYLEYGVYNSTPSGRKQHSTPIRPEDFPIFYDDDSIWQGDRTYKWYEPVYFTGYSITGESHRYFYVYVRYREMSPQPPPP